MLVFRPELHTYEVDGMRVPSVTQIIKQAGLGTDYTAIPPDVLEKARRRGVAVHSICEAIDNGNDDPFLEPDYRGYATSYERFIQETGYKSEATEIKLHHPKLYYAGCADMLGTIGGQRCVIDRKSTRMIDGTATSVQVAAYRGALMALYPETPIDAVMALHLRPDGIYQIHYYDADEAWDVFQAALRIYQYKNRSKRK